MISEFCLAALATNQKTNIINLIPSQVNSAYDSSDAWKNIEN